jgi:hypothetical protein
VVKSTDLSVRARSVLLILASRHKRNIKETYSRGFNNIYTYTTNTNRYCSGLGERGLATKARSELKNALCSLRLFLNHKS